MASLVFPLSALASGPFTGNHPEESLPDNAQQVSSDPYQPMVRQVQERLHQLGFDAGPVNGEFSEKTQAALAQFQLSLVIPASGQLDALTLNELGVSTESASAGGSATPESEQ
jgi:peptidoglycan hydrolase-like protein with peptidoglycan-binding domain